MPDKAVALKIVGRVQGVGYRQWMVEAARARGLRGWVRNRSEGWVEAVVAGPGAAIDALVAACRTGPAMADVDEVRVEIAGDAARAALRSSTGFVARGTS